MIEQYKRKPNTICVICQTPLYRRPMELKATQGRAYCSSNCYGLACRKEIPCVICGKLILTGLNKKTCSRSCANKNRAGIKYAGRRSKDKVKHQQALKLRLLRLRGQACERCGYDILEILQIHHKNRNRKNNNLSNLELICPNCHAKEHFLEKSWLKKVNLGGVG